MVFGCGDVSGRDPDERQFSATASAHKALGRRGIQGTDAKFQVTFCVMPVILYYATGTAP